MSLTHLLTQPLTVQTIGPAAVDEYGDEIVGPVGDPAPVWGYLEQASSVEHTVDRDTTIGQWVAYLPAGTVIGRLDRVGYAGQTFEVDGEPEKCFNPRTRAVSHIRARLLVVEG